MVINKVSNYNVYVPLTTIKETFRIVKQTSIYYNNILEPSYHLNQNIIKHAYTHLSNVNIDIVSSNNNIWDKDETTSKNNKVNFINENFLLWNKPLNDLTLDDKKYELIVTTIPYLDIKYKDIRKIVKKDDIDLYKSYLEDSILGISTSSGLSRNIKTIDIDKNTSNDKRNININICLFYLLKCLYLLKDKGIFIFIIPKEFNYDTRFSKIRKFINSSFSIIDIVDCDAHGISNDTEDDLLESYSYVYYIIKNRKPDNVILGRNNLYGFTLNKQLFLNTSKSDNRILKVICKRAKTLEEINMKVCVGNIVWTKIKKDLTDDKNNTRLIYSSEIGNGILEHKQFSNQDRKHYTTIKGSSSPVLLLNRTYSINKKDFNYVILDGSFEYVLDTHILAIEYTGRRLAFSDSDHKKRLVNLYKKVLTSLQHDKLKLYIDLYLGRDVKTSELEKMLPMQFV
jgi:hypothetical protein